MANGATFYRLLLVGAVGVAGYFLLKDDKRVPAGSETPLQSADLGASAQVTDAASPSDSSGMLPPSVEGYFRALIARDYEAAYRLTSMYQWRLEERVDGIRGSFPRVMWPEKFAEAEREVMEDLDLYDVYGKIQSTNFPFWQLFTSGASWRVIEWRAGEFRGETIFFVEVSYPDNAGDSIAPFVILGDAYAPLKRAVISVVLDKRGLIQDYGSAVVEDTDEFFAWALPRVVAVQMRVREEVGSNYLLDVRFFGGGQPGNRSQLVCRNKSTGAVSFSHEYSFTGRSIGGGYGASVVKTEQHEGTFDFGAIQYPQACIVSVWDDAGKEARASFDLAQEPSELARSGHVRYQNCWHLSSFRFEVDDGRYECGTIELLASDETNHGEAAP